MMESQPLLFDLFKQGFNWFMLASKASQTDNT